MAKIPVIIDTDPGVDDFLALMVAKSASNLDIQGVTAVCGNQTLEKTSRNALDICDLLEIDAPVAKGAKKPLNIEAHTAGDVHGESGIGNVVLKKSDRKFDDRYAWDFIYDKACELDGKLEIVAVGPLTNIAIAVLKYPDLYKKVKRLTIMGGSASVGNRTAYAEFNIWGDPLAAEIVFKSKIPVVMVGLDATMKTLLDEKEIAEIKKIESKHSEMIGTLMDGLLEVYHGFGHNGVAIHDALAVSYLIDENVLEVEDYYVTVETISEMCMGRTVVDLNNSFRDKEKNVKVALGVDFELFKKIFKDMVAYYK